MKVEVHRLDRQEQLEREYQGPDGDFPNGGSSGPPRVQLTAFKCLSPERQGQILALTVFYVPSSLEIGERCLCSRFRGSKVNRGEGTVEKRRGRPGPDFILEKDKNYPGL